MRFFVRGCVAVALLAGPAAAAPPFADVTERAGVRFAHEESARPLALPQITGPGLVFRDLDGDGYPDLLFVQGAGLDDVRGGVAPPFAYYRNNGDGTFADRTAAAGLGVRGWGMGALAADLDSDGDQDLVFSFYGRSPALYENQGDGTFRGRDLPAETRGGVPWQTGLAALDSERRGVLDVYAVSYVSYGRDLFATKPATVDIRGVSQPRTLSPYAFSPRRAVFYRNDGHRLAFTERAEAAGLTNEGGKGLAAMVVDVDSDGISDLFVANDVSACALFRGRGDGTFSSEAAAAWVADVAGSMGLAYGDYDHDGLLDVFCSRWVQETHALYRANRRKGRPGVPAPALQYFTNLADGSGLAALGADQVGWGCAFLDVDGDGWEDLVIANGHTYLEERLWTLRKLEPVVMRSDGKGGFARLPAPAGSPLAMPLWARGAAFADLDRDLAVDVALTENRGRGHLWRAEGVAGHGLAVELVGTRSCRDGIGARVEVHAGEMRWTRLATSGDSFLSTSAAALTFRIGGAREARVAVTWPSGARQEIPSVTSDRVVRLVEPE